MPTNGVIETNGHTTSYLEDGPKDGPLIVFVHGWPELSHSWRHQLPAMARLGFHAVAPDLRGYGSSDAPEEVSSYALDALMSDMTGLLDAIGKRTAER